MGTPPDGGLPVPDVIAQAHSNELSKRLFESASAAPMPFVTYMGRCLYEPGLGYYMAGSKKFGSGGDFVTAPEVSPLFGACLAEQCKEVLAITGGGVMELGAGSGRLALSLIRQLSDELWTHYWIVEPSADLQERQRDLLTSELSDAQMAKVQWLTRLPSEFTGVALANEVMDALPVDRIVRTAAGVEVEMLTPGDKGSEKALAVESMSASTLAQDENLRLQGTLEHLEADLGGPLAEGYRTELSQLLPPWITSLSECLTQGALLLIDYGYPRREYYSEERRDGTLQCFYRHHAHNDVTYWPGLQDITAHVDFTAVIEAGDRAGLELLGYTAQAPFLFGCGLQKLAAEQPAVWGLRDTQTTAGRIQQQQAVNRLTLPGEMGERFQVMALGRGLDVALKGFSLLDLSRRL